MNKRYKANLTGTIYEFVGELDNGHCVLISEKWMMLPTYVTPSSLEKDFTPVKRKKKKTVYVAVLDSNQVDCDENKDCLLEFWKGDIIAINEVEIEYEVEEN